MSSNLCKSISHAGQLSALSVSTVTETSQNGWTLRSESLAEGAVRQTRLLPRMVVKVGEIEVNGNDL